MKILLISPTVDEHKRTNKQLMMPQLALYLIEGLTPPGHEVKVVEEEVSGVNLEEDCDLVGISCMTANAPRAYELAQAFRARGKKVVLGGVHPTILPEEALQYADAVVEGEAEGVWATLLDDVAAGRLQRRYHNPTPDLGCYVQKDFSKIIRNRLFNIVPILTTRGCPYDCDFCCVTDLYGTKIRHAPIDNVLKDLKSAPTRNFMFLDDNIIGHPKYAKELFKAIKPLGIKWVGQASVSLLVREQDLLRQAADSGCKGLFFGLESVSDAQLKSMRKAIKDIENLESALDRIRRMGILVHASMIFGFDTDQKDVFESTAKFLIRNKVSTASFNVLTPYPGTRTHASLKAEGRLLTDDWRFYDHNTVVFQPTNMTPLELQEGRFRARELFYKKRSVARRFFGNLRHPLLYLATNYGHIRQLEVEKRRIEALKSVLFQPNGRRP